LPYQAQSAVNFASQAIIHTSQQFIIFCTFFATILLLSSSDPKTPKAGKIFTCDTDCSLKGVKRQSDECGSNSNWGFDGRKFRETMVQLLTHMTFL